MSKFELESLVAEHPNPGNQHWAPFAVTPELEQEAEARASQYPGQSRSAVLPLLHLVQGKFGYVNGHAITWIARKLQIEPIQVLEVVTFYPGLRQSSPGRIHFRVCRTLSCALAGSDELMSRLCELTGIDRGKMDPHHHPIGVSECGNWSVEFVECLAACGFAPVVMANDETHCEVLPEKAEALIDQYKK